MRGKRTICPAWQEDNVPSVARGQSAQRGKRTICPAWQEDNLPSMATGCILALQHACAGFPLDKTRAIHKPHFRIDVPQAHQRHPTFKSSIWGGNSGVSTVS
eukprot:363784-Chlamydomonas_euryale.AAC.17